MDLSLAEIATRRLQFQFLLALYTFAGNSPHTRVQMDDLRQRGVGIRLFANVITNLVAAEMILHGEGIFRITQKGADTVRQALAHPFEDTGYFPPVAPLFVEKLVGPSLGEEDDSAESFNEATASS